MNENEYTNVKLTESEMVEAFDALRKKILLSKIAMIGGFIAIAACFLMNKIVIAIAMMVVFIGGAAKYKTFNEQIKNVSGNGILRRVYNEIFDEAEFDHDGFYDENTIDGPGFAYPYHTVKGTDLVKGKYKDRDISLCDIELIGTSHSDNGTHDSTVFHGLWAIYDLGTKFNANVSIREMNSIEKALSDKGFETDNEAFNKKFSMISDNPAEGKKILTEKLMNQIIAFDEKANAKTNIAFYREGLVHIALNNKKDPFAVKSSDPDALKSMYKAKIKVITDFLDELIEE